MKKLLLCSVILMTSFFLEAQTVFCDFEGETAGSLQLTTIGGSLTQTADVVANPLSDDVNASSTVLKATANAIGGTPAGDKIDAFMFTTGETHALSSYNALKVKIYVEGGSPALLKPRGKFGMWVDASNSPTPGNGWIGVVKDLSGEDGMPSGLQGWQELYFDISTKSHSGNAIQIQIDWQDVRDYNLVIYFDDFELVSEIPTSIDGDEITRSTKIINDNNLVRVSSEATVSEVVVFDMTGRVVSQLQGDEIKQINIANLPGGLYIVKAKAEGKVYTEKVLKR